MKTIVSYAFGLSALVLSACEGDDPLATGQQAVGGGNSEAVVCCKDLFPPGPERGLCISQAAHGLGPCAPADAAVPDAPVPAPVDAGEPDAEVPDASLPDASLPDAGVLVPIP